jgi:hypothetical protein
VSAQPRVQIAFLTGRSNPASCALSPLQSQFLQRLHGPDRLLVGLNFPYEQSEAPHRPTQLLQASCNNAVEYLGSRQGAFGNRYRPVMEALLSRAPRTVLLAGSCGLELFLNLGLDARWLARTTVFAFGPVARSLPASRYLLVQGRRDWLSRWYYPRVHHRVDCGHLDYLAQDEVLRLCEDLVSRVVSAPAEVL